MRKLMPGGSEHSFGIHVAQLAGMPNSVVIRASEIMHHLEQDKISQGNKKSLQQLPKQKFQLNMFELNDPLMIKIRELFDKLDINTITPVEALLKLNELKMLAEDAKK